MVLGNGKANPKGWIHTPELLINGKITYAVKFVGKAEVPEPRGMPMVKMALKKLDFSRQLKRTEGTKPPKVELGISVHSVSISDIKTKELIHNISLHRVSFCADDKEDKRLFAFIAKLEDDKHYCYGLDSLHQANDITLTIGQAFELAYDKFLKENPSAAAPKKLTDMSKRIQELEFENSELRRRIALLEAGNKPETNSNITSVLPQVEPKPTLRPPAVQHSTSNIAVPRRTNQFARPGTGHEQEAIDAFNMQPFAPTNSIARLPQPPSRKSPKQQVDLWSTEDMTNPFQDRKVSRELQEMQANFTRGLAVSEGDITLDSFDPLKH